MFQNVFVCMVCAKSIMDGGRRILVVRVTSRSGAKKWTLPGGRIDPGQTPLGAAMRELREEADAALPEMPLAEQVVADYQTTRLSLKGHPMAFLRERLAAEGVLSCAEADAAKNGTKREGCKYIA